jgi:hypothetical protein
VGLPAGRTDPLQGYGRAARARETLPAHREKVEALAEALLQTEELGADAAAAILGARLGREQDGLDDAST